MWVSGIASVLGRGLSFLVTLALVPVVLRRLGPETYGLWATLISISSFLTYGDFGLGNGLLNAIARADGRGDIPSARRSVSTAFYTLLATGILLSIGLLSLGPAIPWVSALKISPADAPHAERAMMILILCTAASMPLGVVQRVQRGYQRTYVTAAWQCLASVVSLPAILLVVSHYPTLEGLVLAYFGSQVFCLFLSWLWEFLHTTPHLFPSWRWFDLRTGLGLCREGSLFFFLQAMGILSYVVDNLIIAHALGQTAVAMYAVAARLFTLFPMVANFWLAPLWPAYGEAAARGDVRWVRECLRRSALISTASCLIVSIVLMVASRRLFTLWVGPQYYPDFRLQVVFCLWAVAYTLGDALAMFLNGVSLLKSQLVTSAVTAAVSVTLKVLFCRHLGIMGVPLAMLVTSSLISIPLLLVITRNGLATLSMRNQPARRADRVEAPGGLTCCTTE